jgi:hypothetical protein
MKFWYNLVTQYFQTFFPIHCFFEEERFDDMCFPYSTLLFSDFSEIVESTVRHYTCIMQILYQTQLYDTRCTVNLGYTGLLHIDLRLHRIASTFPKRLFYSSIMLWQNNGQFTMYNVCWVSKSCSRLGGLLVTETLRLDMQFEVTFYTKTLGDFTL